VGREAEFPLVNPDGSAADVLTLWPALLERADCRPIYDRAVDGSEFLVGVEADTWSCVTEVGKGTLEISVGPRATLHELARDMEDGLARLKEVVRTSGVRLLGFGIQPKTPASVGLLTPKRRYHALLETIGAGWLKFCVTAADQVQIDMGKDEIVRLANLINAASGVIIAVTANSSVYGGKSRTVRLRTRRADCQHGRGARPPRLLAKTVRRPRGVPAVSGRTEMPLPSGRKRRV
jgi:gamma-glutamylcysteine synthetase